MQTRAVRYFSTLVLLSLANCSGEADTEPNAQAGTAGSALAGRGGSSAGGGLGGGGAPSGSGGVGTGGGNAGSGDGGKGDAGSGGAGDPNEFGEPPIASDLLCGERPGRKSGDTNVLRFESEDGPSVVQIRRVEDGVGTGESLLFHIESFAIVRDGRTTCLEGAALSYTNSHHNWSDVAEAEADGIRYRLEFNFGTEMTYTLVALEGDSISFQEPLRVTGAPPFCWSCPGSVRIAISELMLNNVGTLADESGEFEPWIELYNPSAEDIDLSGYTLSNHFGERARWALPAVTIPRHEVLTIFADGEPEQGPLHTNFRLAVSGGELVLTRPDGGTDGGFVFGSMPADASLEFAWDANDYVGTRAPTPNVPPAE